ncbi:response regulator [Nocardiopsis sp. HNM0947]|uniref:Response regulator n=1 Tax=Nocardiopsis coralli TaxID=2772213 RepID=A0ABR9PF12_9ACTN|nr:response regulator [Nocardiopsis coralli]MBE3002315.1 response regulator [Nocardiopsis coralli]
MIKVLIVEDDARVAHNHRCLVEETPGFTVTGVAHTAGAAMGSIARERPHLILLDLFLPDRSGMELLRTLRGPGRSKGGGGPEDGRSVDDRSRDGRSGDGRSVDGRSKDGGGAHEDGLVDALVITALRDVGHVREALHNGAVHYLIKPFSLASLRDQLERYAAARSRLEQSGEATQNDVDRVVGLLRPASNRSHSKALTSPTGRMVAEALRQAGTDLSATEAAEVTGVARVTARRYLEQLCTDGRAVLTMRHGSTGRPEHRYRWVA